MCGGVWGKGVCREVWGRARHGKNQRHNPTRPVVVVIRLPGAQQGRRPRHANNMVLAEGGWGKGVAGEHQDP